MKNLLTYIIAPIFTTLIVLFITPIIRKFAVKYNLVDKPNSRKVHKESIPLVGGIAIFLGALFTCLVFNLEIFQNKEILILLFGSILLLLTGIVDDYSDIRASYKLLIQIALAYFVSANGIRLESFFGIFGINAIPVTFQYILTILIITGTINAINLTDGIDGLAGGIAILGLSTFAILAFVLGKTELMFVFLLLIGALIGFLRYNLSSKTKIFMGDSGSLFLGFILVISGIILINASVSTSLFKPTFTTIVGLFILPVFDSIRVYVSRLKNGLSPFTPDKTHFHHLILNMGYKHGKATIIILVITIFLFSISILLGNQLSLTLSIVSVLLLFYVISKFLSIHNDVFIWRKKLNNLEKNHDKEFHIL